MIIPPTTTCIFNREQHCNEYDRRTVRKGYFYYTSFFVLSPLFMGCRNCILLMILL